MAALLAFLRFTSVHVMIFVSLPLQSSTLQTRNFISVQLYNGSYLAADKENLWSFPQIESLFSISTTDVKAMKIENSDIAEIDADELKKLKNLKTIEFTFNKRLKKLHADTFAGINNITYVNLAYNNLDYIEPGTFDELFQKYNVLGELDLRGNKLHFIPKLKKQTPGLTSLTLDDNPIVEIREKDFANMVSLEKLSMEKTGITKIPGEVFLKNPNLHYIDLRDNEMLTRIDKNAFVGTTLRKLYLSNTAINYLPHMGLDKLIYLEIKDAPNLWEISDDLVSIPTLQTVHVSSNQRFLCCAFEMKRARIGIYADGKSPTVSIGQSLCPTAKSSPLKVITATVVRKNGKSSTEDPLNGFLGKRRKKRQIPGFEGFLPPTRKTSNQTKISKETSSTKSKRFFPNGGGFITKLVIHSDGAVICNPTNTGKLHINKLKPAVCLPEPDELRPCDDIMGNTFLTVLSWMVAIVALAGNAIVFSVLLLSRRALTVTKFLLINLSFADLCLALYLFILVSASTHTQGSYYNFVKEWQYGGGCDISGFIAIFSSQFSVLVLVVITVERYVAIVYAMHFHRRVQMIHARISILVCWIIALILAILPLLGVNSYREVAICLPFRTTTKTDLGYIGFLLVMNVLLFVFVLISYIRMYCIIKSPHLNGAQQRNDSDIAKRMALLVFTDFFCWAPIAFVGLVSAFGSHTLLGIDVKKSKYLLVIFFPINSLCNPFLYAVSTNSFKRDLLDVIFRCGFFQERIAKMTDAYYTLSQNGQHSLMQQMSDTHTNSMHVSRNSSLFKPRKSIDKDSLLTKAMLKRHKESNISTYQQQVSLNGENKLNKQISETNTSDTNTQISTPILQNNNNIPLENATLLLKEKENPDDEAFGEKLSDDVFEYSKPETNGKIRSKCDADDTIPLKQMDCQTSRFSQYDLTAEAFQESKETSYI